MPWDSYGDVTEASISNDIPHDTETLSEERKDSKGPRPSQGHSNNVWYGPLIDMDVNDGVDEYRDKSGLCKGA